MSIITSLKISSVVYVYLTYVWNKIDEVKYI